MPTQETSRSESVQARYAVTLLTQVVQIALSVVTAGIVPKALGPSAYGSYNFILGMAATLRNLLDPSAQHAFFTFSSQDEKSGPLTRLYSTVLLIQFALTLGLIGLSVWMGIVAWLWPDQRLDQILLITILDWVTFLALTLRQLGDSKGQTIRPQLVSLIVSATSVFALIGLKALHWLNLYTYVFLNLASSLALCGMLVYWLIIIHGDACWGGQLHGRVRGYLARWWSFAGPLVLLEYYLPITTFLSAYCVQVWYGSTEQGYLALASRWSAIVLVFSNAALMIVWREIAVSLAAGDRQRAAQVYLRSNRFLFFVTVVLSLWLCLSSRTLVMILAGAQYQSAIPVLMLMAFYPVQQAYGQLNVATLKAAQRTPQLRNLRFFLSIPDLLLMYVLLAPPTARVPGLGLGAIGVAIHMVGYGLLSVQAYEWSNLWYWGMSYTKIVQQKLMAAFMTGCCAVLVLRGLESILRDQWGLSPIFSLMLASPVYFFLMCVALLVWPSLLIGVDRAGVRAIVRSLQLSASSVLSPWRQTQ